MDDACSYTPLTCLPEFQLPAFTFKER